MINGNVGIGEPFEDIRMLDVDDNPNNPGSPGCTLVHPDSIGALDTNDNNNKNTITITRIGNQSSGSMPPMV